MAASVTVWEPGRDALICGDSGTRQCAEASPRLLRRDGGSLSHVDPHFEPALPCCQCPGGVPWARQRVITRVGRLMTEHPTREPINTQAGAIIAKAKDTGVSPQGARCPIENAVRCPARRQSGVSRAGPQARGRHQ